MTKNFHSNLLKEDKKLNSNLDKKLHEDFDIYYIGYITIRTFKDCGNISGVNPLYLIIYSATGYFKDKNGEKYLIIDSTEKYEEGFSRIRSKIKTINGGKELFYEKIYARIGFNTDDDLPLNKPLKFPTLTITVRCVIQEGEKLYPQIYLDQCLYEL